MAYDRPSGRQVGLLFVVVIVVGGERVLEVA